MAHPASGSRLDMPRLELAEFDHGFDRLREITTSTIAATILLASAVVAAWIPSRRAARVDPMSVLRCE